ncbi:MSEP-CTERM sorting domain-containing protein [Apibacter sp. HY039]|uniref:MSEP-CTERM sorting domain-containing protein n=1 Tax=Apibacter sp. HY039 TaxID=2501476 RepID=UPI0021043052|nr:MSEP-CTERM sorting domain-containing protein [Apibacter sp. HY039]
MFSIPQWMISEYIQLYPWTFLMPSLFYSLLVIVLRLTPENKTYSVWQSFLYAVLIPVFWFLIIQVIIPLRLNLPYNFSEHLTIVFIIVTILLFFFLLIRGIYILTLRKNELWKKYELLWKIPVALILPLLGLYINNSEFKHWNWTLFNQKGGIFGDFNSLWFYILAIINGSLICIPDAKKTIIRLLLFLGKSITFAYTLYFFLVFIPFLPLSIFAIVILGLGFLLLTPLILFILYIHELSKDFLFLQQYYSKNILRITSFLAFLLIPTFITIVYLNDRKNLNEALDYVYHPDYSQEYSIDTQSLSKSLQTIKYYKQKNNNTLLSTSNIPYLSSYFNWLVLDNLTLSDTKIDYLEQIFFGYNKDENRGIAQNTFIPTQSKDSVKISNIEVKSHFDIQQKAWKSSVDFKITNYTNSRTAEYQTFFELPAGCWISNYYLYVNDRKESGILAEKKSALWVYSQIVNYRQDPGILYYLTGNKVAFRVFPFLENETRKTGIEFIHKDPIQLSIDGHAIQLGKVEYNNQIIESANKNILYIPAERKQFLSKVQRKPYYHFIIDISSDSKQAKNNYIQRIESLLSRNYLDVSKTRISLVNSYISPVYSANDNWPNVLKNEHNKGGFFLDRAIKSLLVNTYLKTEEIYPIIVIVTDSLENAIIENNFADLSFTFPESSIFYHLDKNGVLNSHSLISNPKIILERNIYPDFTAEVLAYPNVEKPIGYLTDDDSACYLLKKEMISLNEAELKAKDWNSSLEIQGVWMSQIINPKAFKENWTQLVKYSFLAQIMNPATSFIVVENEAQKAVLKNKQNQVLKSNQALDFDDETERMSEPGIILLFIFLFIFILIKKKKVRLN